MKKVILENIGSRLKSIDLNHPLAPKEKRTFYQGTHNAATGKIGQIVREMYIHETILIPVGHSKSDLPAWVADLEEVIAAVARDELKIKTMVDMDAQMARLRAREAKRAGIKTPPTEEKSMVEQISELVHSSDDSTKKEAE
jgi:hypothetical protein